MFAAYGWPADLTDEQILERLVALNAERAAEEARGLIRWLRPEFQAPQAGGAKQAELDLDQGADEPRLAAASTRPSGERCLEATAKHGQSTRQSNDGRLEAMAKREKSSPAGKRPKTEKLPWPKERAERTKAVQEALAAATTPLEPAEIAKQFTRGSADQVTEILEALCSLGLARKSRGKYSRV